MRRKGPNGKPAATQNSLRSNAVTWLTPPWRIFTGSSTWPHGRLLPHEAITSTTAGNGGGEGMSQTTEKQDAARPTAEELGLLLARAERGDQAVLDELKAF